MKLKKLIITGLSLALGVAGFAGSANAATKITTPSKNNFRVITKTVKVGKVTIPANTRVYVPSVSKKGNKQYANVELGTLRYQIRHETSAKYLKVRVNHNFKTSKTVATDQLPVTSKPKTKVSQKGRQYQNPTIRFTTDGYVEYFKDDKASTKPISSTKITKSKTSANTTYVYSKNNMLKLPDQKITNKGNFRYRLTVHFYGGAADTNAALKYSVGNSKNYFYTRPNFYYFG